MKSFLPVVGLLFGVPLALVGVSLVGMGIIGFNGVTKAKTVNHGGQLVPMSLEEKKYFQTVSAGVGVGGVILAISGAVIVHYGFKEA